MHNVFRCRFDGDCWFELHSKYCIHSIITTINYQNTNFMNILKILVYCLVSLWLFPGEDWLRWESLRTITVYLMMLKFKSIFTGTYIYIHTHTHIHTYMYLCVCVCVCVWNLKLLIAWSIFVYFWVSLREEQSKEMNKHVYKNI
jgi:hypothetical protein